MRSALLLSGVSIWLLAIGAYLAPTEWIMGRNAIFLSLILLFLQFLKIRPDFTNMHKGWFFLVAITLCIGLSQYLWVMNYGDSTANWALANINYTITYKYIITFSVLIFLVNAIPNHVIEHCKKFILIGIGLSFSVAVIEAFHVYFTEDSPRANIGGISTTAAYLATLQGLLCLYTLVKIPVRYRSLLMLLVAVMTYIIIIMTGTRSATLLFPFILFLIACKTLRIKELKKFIPVFTVLLLIPLFFSNQIRERFVEGYHDFNQDSTNNSTSIGSRFSMWESGIFTAKYHLIGQSAESRSHDITHYIMANERGNPEALRNIPYHLHNEVIEIASLQGVVPALLMVLFYIVTIWLFKNKGKDNLPILTFTLPLVIFGGVDVLFIYPKVIVCIFSMLCIYNVLSRLEQP
ncbi:O-antigen ligase family protein [Rosenbergiella australiborealis]|uniref:O-antigen ligase family protein n=1 Tax=Rosenbergiella australiborealis TaxID=1544696 RepID=UPI001F4D7EDE|nr:O-antigen ligase family protein [Rosenbergiella australiborealis]